MKVLIAEDDPISSRVLEASLVKWGYEVMTARNGKEAWEVLRETKGPMLAILDWMMPEIDGTEVCRRARQIAYNVSPYIILLTARTSRQDIAAGLEAGANDYVAKPFDQGELRARLQVGVRMLELQASLAERVRELEDALARVKRLQGLLPICSYCKRVRNDHNYWQQVETYITEHTEAAFSHGICPECYEKVVRPELERYPNLKSKRS